MYKKLSKKIRIDHYEHPVTLVCTIKDTDGYISITGDVIRLDGEYIMGGCLHELIAKHFPSISPFIPLHFVNIKTELPMYFIENSIHNIVNGEIEYEKKQLFCTDQEMLELKALCDYGIHKKFNKAHGSSGWYSTDKDARRVFFLNIERMGIPQRISDKVKEFYSLVSTL